MIAARSLSSASASEQQCPATMRPLNLWRSAASAICPSERALGESLSSTWKSRSRPFALAASNSLSSIASLRGPGASPRNVSPPSTPPCFATVSTVKRKSASSVSARSIGNSATACKRDAAFPLLAHLGEHAPRDLGLLRVAVDMRAQRAGAVREGAAQREVHALGDILARPVGRTVGHHGIARAEMRAVRILRAMPDVALVDMGVHIDEARQHDAVVEIDARQPVLHRRADRGDARVVDHDAARREAVGVGHELRAICDEAHRHARIDEAIARDVRGMVMKPGICSSLCPRSMLKQISMRSLEAL